MTESTADGVFEEYRSLLFRVAYDVLGSVADAEDVVQETWLRWTGIDQAGVQHPRAYLARIATRRALDRLRQVRRRRETYIGPWLPEPLLNTTVDPSDEVDRAEDLTFGMQVVLQSLTPAQRAVFVLREAFGFEYAQIAEMLDRTPAAVRQTALRARTRLRDGRPRQPADRRAARRASEQFLRAALGGDLEQAIATLAPDVVLYSDGGGRVDAARRPVHGADRVGRLIAVVGAKFAGLEIVWRPSDPFPTAVLISPEGPKVVMSVQTGPDGARIEALHFQLNPDKLTR